MNTWTTRPKEEAYLLNPAYLAIILRRLATGYSKARDGRGLPYPLSLLGAAMVLHGPTRRALPYTTRTSMYLWLRDRADLRLDTPQRAVALSKYVREAVLFGHAHGVISVDATLDLRPVGRITESRVTALETDEMRSVFQAATKVGRWFAIAGDNNTILSLWGVKP